MQQEVNATTDDASSDLWHKWLAHISKKGLQILGRKSAIPLPKGTSLHPCDYCLLDKHHRVSFQKTSNRETDRLDLVHSDVCGPIEVESLGGSKYFLTFIDDASRKVCVYFLRTKYHVFQYFKEFHAMVERETGRSLKCLRIGNRGEYMSNEFKEYCLE